MAYKVVEQSGDSLAVPQLVLAQLPRTDGDTVRVALYLLATKETDPAVIARALGLKSINAAKRALQYWAGAGLLESVSLSTPQTDQTDEQKSAKIDLSSINDPYVAVLCEEAQIAFGKALSRNELQRLVGLYLTDGWSPDVLLLCCADVAQQGRRTIASVSRELERWRSEGVETGEDAERYLKRRDARSQWCEQVAPLFAATAQQLTRWERTAIVRWQEEWHDDIPMIEEALLHAENKRTVRYVDGILRAWRAQGLTTVQAVRGKGQLSGSNILSTGKTPQKPMKDMFHCNWNAVFDDETEG